MRKPGQSDWKDGFLFVGNELALDFLNTRPVQNGEPMELLTDFAALLRWLRAAEQLSADEAGSLQQRWGGTAKAERVTTAVRELREKLREDVLAWERGAAIRRTTVAELDRLLSEHPMRTRLTAHGKGYSKEMWFEVRKPEDLFAPVADSAASLFAGTDRKKVRKCVQCVLHFQDTSKKGTRRWCSMQMCGNRAKVAAYASRRRRRK